MKAFIFSLVLLLIAASVSIINLFYIDYAMDKLITEASAMPEPEHDEALTGFEGNNFKFLWEKHRAMLALSVNLDYVYAVDLAITSVGAYGKTKELPEYNASKKALILALNRIKDIEKFSIHNII